MGKDAGGGCDFAVGVVLVGGDGGAAGIYNAHYVALEIGDVITVVFQGIGSAVGIIEEVNGIRAPGQPPQTVAAHGQGGSQPMVRAVPTPVVMVFRLPSVGLLVYKAVYSESMSEIGKG